MSWEPREPKFLRLGDDDDDGPVISREAFQLHGFALINSVRGGTPGFVSDDYLNSVAAESTTPAAELCLIGLWERVVGGYLIHDPMVAEVVRLDNKMRQDTEFCSATGGHQPDARCPELCVKCHAPFGPLPEPPGEHR